MNILVDKISGTERTSRIPLHVRVVLTVVGVFFLVGASFATVVTVDLLFPGTALDVIWKMSPDKQNQFVELGWFGPVFLIAISAALVVAAIGLLRRRNWGRWLTVGLLLINLGPDIPSLIGGDWSVIPFALFVAALVIYLCLPTVGRALSRKGRIAS